MSELGDSLLLVAEAARQGTRALEELQRALAGVPETVEDAERDEDDR